MVGRGVRSGPARSQHPRQRLVRLIQENEQRMLWSGADYVAVVMRIVRCCWWGARRLGLKST
jgi:hypothetical protein